MTQLYLVLTILGFAITAVMAPMYSLENPDNVLFITNPKKTIELMFGDSGTAAISADLLWVFLVFCVWVMWEGRAREMKRPWAYVVLAALFGLSGPFPLFLYMRERKLEERPRPL